MTATSVIEAVTDKGTARFVVTNPPTAAVLLRWQALATFMPDATWTAKPGSDVR